MKMSYFEWIAEVAAKLGKPKIWGAEIVEDTNWFGCWDDGMTPAEAIKEAREAGILDDVIPEIH